MNRRCVSSFFIHLILTRQIIWSILLVPSGSSQRKMTVLICPPPSSSLLKKSAVQCCSLLPIINVKYGVSNLLYKLKYRLRPPLKKKRHRSSYIVAFGTLQVVVWPRSGADVYYGQPIFQFLRSCIYLELSHDFRLKCVQCVAWNVGPKTTLTMQLCLQS